MSKQSWRSECTPFQRKVYEALLRIPKGQVRTYAQIARLIGRPKAARAVGQALKRNRWAPQIPCHRVIASSGKLGGYSGPGGLAAKRRLLLREGAIGLGVVLLSGTLALSGPAAAEVGPAPAALRPAGVEESASRQEVLEIFRSSGLEQATDGLDQPAPEEPEIEVRLSPGDEQDRFNRLMNGIKYEVLTAAVPDHHKVRIRKGAGTSWQQLFAANVALLRQGSDAHDASFLFVGGGEDTGIHLQRIVYQPVVYQPADAHDAEAFLAEIWPVAWNPEEVRRDRQLCKLCPDGEGVFEKTVRWNPPRKPPASAAVRIRVTQDMKLQILLPAVPQDQWGNALRILAMLVAKLTRPPAGPDPEFPTWREGGRGPGARDSFGHAGLEEKRRIELLSAGPVEEDGLGAEELTAGDRSA